jgi:hypothetical protein
MGNKNQKFKLITNRIDSIKKPIHAYKFNKNSIKNIKSSEFKHLELD